MIKIKSLHLFSSAVLLLLIPLVLFICSWLNIFWTLVLTAQIIYLFKELLPLFKNTFTETVSIKISTLILGSAILLSWIIYGGVGKIGYQNFDYVKHNSIFYDLMNSSWPVVVNQEENSYHLVYYLAYYLVPSLMGKLSSSLFVLEIFSIIQMFIGLMLVWLLTLLITNFRFPLLIVLGMIFWGGLDVIGNQLFFQGYSHDFAEFPEWWAGASNFQFTGFTDLLYWVPQHALGGWLTTILCFLVIQKRISRILPFIVSLALLWSPFVTIGLLPFLVVVFFLQPSWKQKIEWCFSRYGVFALLLVLILMGYYSTSNFEQPFKWQLLKMGNQEFFPRYFAFLVLEVGLPILFLYWSRKVLSREIRLYLYATMVAIVIIPHIYLGVYSDFAMRGSIPALFSIFMLTLLCLENNFSKKRALLVGLYVLLTSYSAISDFYRAQKLKHIELGYGPTINFDPTGISMQYLGRKNSFFYKIFF